VTVGYVLWSGIATAETGGLGEAIGSALLLFMVLIGLASPLVYRGWQTRKTYETVTGLPTPSSAIVDDGDLVKVSGCIKDTTETITSPVQSTSCAVAFWKVGTLRRYDVLNHMSYWSVEGIGIDAEPLVIADGTQEVVISDIDSELHLSVGDELDHLLSSTENSILDSAAEALDPPGFEERRTPSEGWPQAYVALGDRVGIEPETTEPPGLLGRALNRVRVPAGTVQFQERTLGVGDAVTVVGTVAERHPLRLRLRGTESMDPVLTRSSLTELERRLRRAYRIQLYGIPMVVTALSSLAGIGVFL
jgi:hypothetical protein